VRYVNYKNKIVLITGAAKGIGKDIAYAYAKLGCIVIIVDKDQEEIRKLEQLWIGENLQIILEHVDVRLEDKIIALFETIHKQYGKIDILINNAGVGTFKPLIQLTVNEFDEVYQTNLRSCFITSREFAKYNRGDEYGRIINISSTRYLMSEANSEAYAASKGGIISLTHALAATLSNRNLTVNAISPGWIHTGSKEELSQEDHNQHFSKRVGNSNDIVKACLYLTDEDNNFITGQNIIIDGGMTKKMIYV